MADVERYVNTDSTAGGDGTTDATAGANRAYATLSEWNTQEATDLVTATNTHRVRCSAPSGSVDTSGFNISGWTTSSTYHITIEVEESDRHDGTGGTGYRVIAAYAYQSLFRMSNANITVIGVSVNNSGVAEAIGFQIDADNIKMINCLSYDNTGGQAFYYSGGTNGYGINCIAYESDKGFHNTNPSNCYLYNCISMNAGTYGFQIGGWRTMYCKNCYAGGAGTDDYHIDANATLNFTTSHDTDGTGDTTTAMAVGSGAYFTNVTPGSEDCKITSESSGLHDVATDLSSDGIYPFDYDFQGTSRPATDWDVGAFQIVGGVGGLSIPIAMYYYTKNIGN